MSLLDNQYELPWLESRLCHHLTTKRFLAKIFYLQAPNHLELTLQIILKHVAEHLTSPAMNFCPVISKKIYCYLREFTAESQPNIYNQPK